MKRPLFKLNPDPTFSEFVELTVPGSPVPAQISITWRYKTRQALNEWLRANHDRPVADALAEVIAAWGEPVTDEHGEEQPGVAPVGADGDKLHYSRDALAAIVLSYPVASNEFVSGYIRALTVSRVKN